MINRIRQDKACRLKAVTVLSLSFNMAYAIGNAALGIKNQSYWFITMGAYFLVLSIMRSSCVYRLRRSTRREKPIRSWIGGMLIMLSVVLLGSVILSHRMDLVKPVHRIVMLAIATYTTFKTTVAVINIVKVRKTGNAIWIALRNISCADAAAAIVSMQRSMLVTFGQMEEDKIRLMNLLTGIGACLVVLALSLGLMRKSGAHMDV